jgi:hypothetical protein
VSDRNLTIKFSHYLISYRPGTAHRDTYVCPAAGINHMTTKRIQEAARCCEFSNEWILALTECVTILGPEERDEIYG